MTCVHSAAGVRIEAKCERGGVYRKCELFQACRLSRSWALLQDPQAADSRCWELYYFPPELLTLILQLGDMKVSPPLPLAGHTPGLLPQEGAG